MKKQLYAAIMMGLFATSAFGQPLPPGPPGEPRCRTTTTTTTECTGSAATAAVPSNNEPQAPVYAPPPPQQLPPPVVAPAPGPQPYPYPGQFSNGNPPLFLPMAEGFRLSIDEEGRPVMERRKRVGNKALWSAGLALFLGTPLLSATAAGLDHGSYDQGMAAGMAFLPIIGSFVNAGIEGTSGSDCSDSCTSANHSARAAGWAISGLVQTSGLVMFLVGLGTGPEKVERFPLRFGAAPTQGGAAFQMNGHF